MTASLFLIIGFQTPHTCFLFRESARASERARRESERESKRARERARARVRERVRERKREREKEREEERERARKRAKEREIESARASERARERKTVASRRWGANDSLNFPRRTVLVYLRFVVWRCVRLVLCWQTLDYKSCTP